MKAKQAHLKVMKKVITFCVNTKDHGIIVYPTGAWNGKLDEDYFFEAIGVSDSDYAKDIATRKSVSAYVFLNDSLISAQSKMQECVTLSVAEESVGLNVKLPMVIIVNNKGAIELVNN
jgi:hypothetical protein